jgi:glycosyltransferase involved in cell wall biosynthesis
MYGPAAAAVRAVEPDVVLVHEGHFAVTGMPMLRDLPRSRVYLYVHNPISRSIARPELRRLLAGTRGIIAVSEFIAEQVSHRVGRGGPPISVVHNGVDLDLFAPPAEPVVNEVPRVVFAGRIGPGKGVDRLVDASVQLHSDGAPHRLTVVGRALHHTGPELSSFEQDLRRRAAPAGRGIDFLPFLPPQELAQLFGQADIVCVPTVTSEPFGLVAVEAMASGACVVVSSRGALPEVVGDSGVVVDPEVRPLREALADLLMNRQRRETLASSGVERARSFSWAASHRRLISALEES